MRHATLDITGGRGQQLAVSIKQVSEERTLPNIKSAKKRVKTNKRDEIKNRDAKATLKTALKKTTAAVLGGYKEVAVLLPETQGLIARTAKRGIIHKNKAARLQSRMMKNANKSAQK